MKETAKSTVTQLQGSRPVSGQELERELLMVMFRLRKQRDEIIEDVKKAYQKIQNEFDAGHPSEDDRCLFEEIVTRRQAEVISEIATRTKYNYK